MCPELMWDIFLLGGAEEMCSQLETWLDSPDRVNKVTRRVRNDYKWPQISNIHRGCQPELECLIHSSTVWSVPRLCSDHLLIFVTNTHPPQPWTREGVNKLPLAPSLYFPALVTNLTCDAGPGTLNLFVWAEQTLRHTRGNKWQIFVTREHFL